VGGAAHYFRRMNISELRERKRKLERELMTLISAFENETETSVEVIYLPKLMRFVDSDRRTIVGHVAVKIEL
jgi:hypothetical protein